MTETFPVLPLRDIVVFPHMIVPLFVGREKSVRALEEVMKNDKQIFLVAQKDAAEDDPDTGEEVITFPAQDGVGWGFNGMLAKIDSLAASRLVSAPVGRREPVWSSKKPTVPPWRPPMLIQIRLRSFPSSPPSAKIAS